MRPSDALRAILREAPGRVIFVDNEMPFREAVAKGGWSSVFVDRFAGDFGHCTRAGNRLLAASVAQALERAFPAR